MLKFSEIRLDKDEIRTMRKLEAGYLRETPTALLCADLPPRHVDRLKELQFVDDLCLMKDRPTYVAMNQRGYSYLKYVESEAAKRRTETRRFILTIVKDALIFAAGLLAEGRLGILRRFLA